MNERTLSPQARWWIRRGLLGIVVVWGAATVTFIGMQLLPGDKATLIAGGGSLGGATPEVLAAITREYGLDRPLIAQYGDFLARLIHGDLGTSYQRGAPVAELIWSQLGSTVVLALGAAVLGFVLAVVLATSTAARPRGRAVTSTVELVLLSTPSAWVGILALTVFSFELRIFPAIGNDGIASLVLPWVTLALPIAAALAQVMRDGLERALEQPFATTVLSRGATHGRLRWRHLARHSLIPVLTLSGWSLAELLGGVVIVETVFARAGIGQLLVTAVTSRDFPVVAGVVILSAVVFVVVNVIVDALYRVVDPRLRETTP